MAHELFFQYHQHGGPQKIAVRDILETFSPFVRDVAEKWVELEFSPHDSCTVFLDTSAVAVTHFMVSRPCGDPRLDELLVRAASLGNCVSFEAGIERPIIFRESTLRHLPAELLRESSPPLCVPSLEAYRLRLVGSDPG